MFFYKNNLDKKYNHCLKTTFKIKKKKRSLYLSSFMKELLKLSTLFKLKTKHK